jgi:uncharacterized membrane protein YgcG
MEEVPMSRTTLFVSAATALFAARYGSAADVAVGVAVGSDGVEGFHLAVREHYHVEEAVIVDCRNRHIPDDHLPIVFFLSGHARVAPAVILELRAGGKSWMDICLHLGLAPEIFCVEVARSHGPPYGNAFGHWKRPRAEWASIRLPDDDIVTLVNVKFLAERHGMPIDDVVDMRAKRGSFVDVDVGIKADKAKGKGAAEGKTASRDEASSSKGKGRDGTGENGAAADHGRNFESRGRSEGSGSSGSGWSHGGGGGGKGRRR